MNRKMRLDMLLVEKGLFDSRQKAQRVILAGKVRDKNGKILDKPGQSILKATEIEVLNTPKFVSRGGDKLLAAFKAFPINVIGKTCLDIGISTGGFTDCLLKQGAKKIYGIDVGYGQTSWRIRNNPSVILLERTNIRYLSLSDLNLKDGFMPEFVVADVSFISLKLVLNSLKILYSNYSFEGVFLIKPQFEVGKEKVSKGGVVKDPSYHIEAIESIIDSAKSIDFQTNALIASPLRGPAGNYEYLIWLSSRKINDCFIDHEYIKNLVYRTLN